MVNVISPKPKLYLYKLNAREKKEKVKKKNSRKKESNTHLHIISDIIKTVLKIIFNYLTICLIDCSNKLELKCNQKLQIFLEN